MDFMNGTQPSRFKRLAAAIAHFPRTLATLLGVTVRDLDALDGKGCGGPPFQVEQEFDLPHQLMDQGF